MSEKEIPYNPPGMDEYFREGARQNSALFARCDAARARGVKDATEGRGINDNPFKSSPWKSAAWLAGHDEINPPFKVEAFCPKCGHGSYLINGKIEHTCH